MVDPSLLERWNDFRDLGDEDRAAVARSMRPVSFQKDESLIGILEAAERIFVLVDGLAALETVSVNGVRRIIWVFRPGELIGSRSFLDDNVDASEVRALTDGEAVTIATSELERIGESRPDVWLAISRALTKRLSGMADRFLAATTLSVGVRLARLLLDFSGSDSGNPSHYRPLSYPLTHETMAEIVGASRPHVSATLAELEERGAVRRGRGGRLTVRPSRLAEIAREAPAG